MAHIVPDWTASSHWLEPWLSCDELQLTRAVTRYTDVTVDGPMNDKLMRKYSLINLTQGHN